ncbi:MAG: lysylphosphatidylglycerol synthase domain-containing protein, partial [Bacteroidota bacterium]
WFITLFTSKLEGLIQWQYLFWFALSGMVVFGGLLFYFWPRIKDRGIVKKLTGILTNIIRGVLSIRSVKNKPAFIGHTLFIWVMYYLMAYVLFFSLEATQHLDLWFGVLVLVMGAFGMGAPVNGGIGAYHILVGKVFLLRGLTDKEGILMATFMHTAQTLTIILAGGLSLLIGMVLMARVSKNKVEDKAVIGPLDHS